MGFLDRVRTGHIVLDAKENAADDPKFTGAQLIFRFGTSIKNPIGVNNRLIIRARFVQPTISMDEVAVGTNDFSARVPRISLFFNDGTDANFTNLIPGSINPPCNVDLPADFPADIKSSCFPDDDVIFDNLLDHELGGIFMTGVNPTLSEFLLSYHVSLIKA